MISVTCVFVGLSLIIWTTIGAPIFIF
jgi:hypothetical protein